MIPLSSIYQSAYQDFLNMRFKVHPLKDSYIPLPSNSDYIKSPVDALSYARRSMLYEWYLDNGCYEVIEDLFDHILLPEIPVELQGASFKELVYTISPETKRIVEGKTKK